MELKDYQEAHTEVGIMLSRLADTRDMKILGQLQDNLSNRLAITPVNNLSELYEVIMQTVDAVKNGMSRAEPSECKAPWLHPV